MVLLLGELENSILVLLLDKLKHFVIVIVKSQVATWKPNNQMFICRGFVAINNLHVDLATFFVYITMLSPNTFLRI
jgi:hypothetical protein